MIGKLLIILIFPIISFASVAMETLLDIRGDFQTTIIKKVSGDEKFVTPPKEIFSLIKYQTELGGMNAYVSPRPKVKKKWPAIIWITGGFPVGGIGEAAWNSQPELNDQSAKVYREQGLVMMYPSFRGTMQNPGIQEGFYGEVNDVLSALKYLKSLDYVDSNNIYLGGHSTGGTLVLLVAAATSEFKAIFAFGPVAAPIQYGTDYALHDPQNEMENKLRAPALFLNLIQSNTFVIEGSDGNIDALRQLESFNKNPKVKFIEIKAANHFELLFPVNNYIAEKISQPDIGDIALTEDVLNKAFLGHLKQ